MRRTSGMTLIEVLASLALLGSVLMGAAWWVRGAADVGLRFDREVNQERTVAAVFDAIDHDLAVGDDDDGTPESAKAAKVAVKDGGLEVRTREPGVGAVVHRFELRPVANELTLATRRVGRPASGLTQHESPRVVLGEVATWEATFDAKKKTLHVALKTESGRTCERTWSFP
jgi:prepilin-type N-terminal cleavage/methylation domain-containing protein